MLRSESYELLGTFVYDQCDFICTSLRMCINICNAILFSFWFFYNRNKDHILEINIKRRMKIKIHNMNFDSNMTYTFYT